MSRASGFVLFEYVIAFACSALMIFMVASVLGELYVRITHYSEGCIATIEVARAWFLLEHDCSYASCHSVAWKKRSPSEFVYAGMIDDCGWSIKLGRLLRKRGFYDASHGVWHNAHETVALLGVQRFEVRWFTHGAYIDGCEVTLGARGTTSTHWIACLNNRSIAVNHSSVKS